MRKQLFVCGLALGLALGAKTGAAGPEPRPAPPERTGPAQETEKVAYLGVATGPLDRALAAQLKLPRGLGLVVVHVEGETPAAGVLKVHDVLTKVDDQLLFNPEQLAALIRLHQAGDEVRLTFVREGQEQQGKAKLGEHEVSRHELEGGFRWPPNGFEVRPGPMGPWDWGDPRLTPGSFGPRERGGPPGGGGQGMNEPFDPAKGTPLSGNPPTAVSRQVHRINPDGTTLQIVGASQGYAVTIRDAGGKSLYSGTVRGADNLEGVPEAYRNQVRSLLQASAPPGKPEPEHPEPPLQ